MCKKVTSYQLPVTDHKRKGFTLLELVIVMAIITILAGLIVSGAQLARRRGVKTKTLAAIESMGIAICMYEVDMGRYPPDTEGVKSLVEGLTKDPGSPYWTGPYMDFKAEDLKDGYFIDPWGNPYQYNSSSPQHNVASYDLYSFGEDGLDETPDDITNW